jgi:S-layer homology domain
MSQRLWIFVCFAWFALTSFSPAVAQVLSEDFESVTPPELPAHWVATNAQGPEPPWRTVMFYGNKFANVDKPQAVADKRLDSPPFRVLSSAAVLRYYQNVSFGIGDQDGGVLEISIDGGPFQDVLDAGGIFLVNGYNGVISGVDNPLLGRAAFVKVLGGDAVVRLPSAPGSLLVVRWRMGSGTEVSPQVGWDVDNVRVCDGYDCGGVSLPVGIDLMDDSGNDVLEAPEAAGLNHVHYNNSGSFMAPIGTLVSLDGPGGTDWYKINDDTADYGFVPPYTYFDCLFIGNCYNIQVTPLGPRPVQHWDAQLVEELSNGVQVNWALHVGGSFADVPSSNPFYKDIETIFHRGITGGCGDPDYCPDDAVLREQMAVFLLKAGFGWFYLPPPAAGLFDDVPASDPFAPWVEDLYNQGITGGCSASPLLYCPDHPVLRRQMAVFLLKALEGSSYVPPDCTGIFSDVPCPGLYTDWIEDLYNREIAAGCGGNLFCPNNPNTRGQMAVFLTKTFGLVLYGP